MIFILAAPPPHASARALFLTDIATSDVGLPGAGWVARDQDPATLYRNFSGMILVEGNQALVGVQLLYVSVDIKFSNQGSSAFLGSQDGGNSIDVFPAASVCYACGLDQDFSMGSR